MDKEFEEWLNNCPVKYNQINDSDEYRFYIKTKEVDLDIEGSEFDVANSYEGYEGIAVN